MHILCFNLLKWLHVQGNAVRRQLFITFHRQQKSQLLEFVFVLFLKSNYDVTWSGDANVRVVYIYNTH